MAEAVESEPRRPLLRLHMEPGGPIEVSELTGTLSALAHQYQVLAASEGIVGKPVDARLLVSSVSPGSIDINFVPDLVAAGALLAPLVETVERLEKFGSYLARLIRFFSDEPKTKVDDIPVSITARDCDDAISIAQPIANHGGNQNVSIVNNTFVFSPVLEMDAAAAQSVVRGASFAKLFLQDSQADRRQRVPMIWSRLDREKAKTEGKASPDKAIIEEIDPRPHPVFFTDDLTYLKREMIVDDENPYQKVYFVDVEVSKANGKVTSYRVIGYHGKDDLD